MTAWRNAGYIREARMLTVTSYGAASPGVSVMTFVGLAVMSVVVWSTELVGASSPEPSEAPMSQLLMVSGAPSGSVVLIPYTNPPLKLPARLSQKTLLNSVGLLNTVVASVEDCWNRVCRLHTSDA